MEETDSGMKMWIINYMIFQRHVNSSNHSYLTIASF